MRPWEIKKLTWRQIRELYHHLRDDKGVVVKWEGEDEDDNERMRREWREQGLSEKECDLKMQEFNDMESFKYHLKQKYPSITPEEMHAKVEEVKREMLKRRRKAGFSVRS